MDIPDVSATRIAFSRSQRRFAPFPESSLEFSQQDFFQLMLDSLEKICSAVKERSFQENLFSREQAAQYFGCSERMLDQYRAEKKGPKYIRMGRLVRYKKSDLDDFIKKNTVSPKKRSYQRTQLNEPF